MTAIRKILQTLCARMCHAKLVTCSPVDHLWGIYDLLSKSFFRTTPQWPTQIYDCALKDYGPLDEKSFQRVVLGYQMWPRARSGSESRLGAIPEG